MTSIPYTFTVVAVDEEAKCMEVVYENPEFGSMRVGVRLPFENETLEQVVDQFSPAFYWNERVAARKPVTVGTQGQATTLVAPPEPIPPTIEEVRAGMRLSFAQLISGLVVEGWITVAEGEGWLDGILPAPVEALLNTLPPQERFVALARAKRPSEVLRSNALVSALAAAEGKTDEDLDAFFLKYAVI